jgi:chromosome segregation ATPase
MRKTREEAQQSRLDWAKKKAEMAEGDIMRSDNVSSNLNSSAPHINTVNANAGDMDEISGFTEISEDEEDRRKKKDIVLNITQAQLDVIVRNRVALHTKDSANGRAKPNQEQELLIHRLKKEIGDMKFMQELDQNESKNGRSTNINDSSNKAQLNGLKEQLSVQQDQTTQIEAENSLLKHKITSLQDENLDLRATVEASSPTAISSTDAYKKALSLRSELLEVKNELTNEVTKRKATEKKLQEFENESASQMALMEQANMNFKNDLSTMGGDLQEGVTIMKGLEEELTMAQDDLETEKDKNEKLEELIKNLQSEKKHYLETTADEMDVMEGTFNKEKESLEKKCQAMEEEIQGMRDRVERHSEAKRENMERVLEEKEKEQHERLRAYEKSLDIKVNENKGLQDKITGMEQVIKAYHERARGEIQGFQKDLEDAQRTEADVKQELQTYLDKDKETEEIIEILESELEETKSELEDLREQNFSAAENAKLDATIKAKDHQYMREKKKWAANEKRTREEFKTLKMECSELREQNHELLNERDDLADMIDSLQGDNKQLKSDLRSMERTLESHTMTLETNQKRVQSLEQELVRAQSKASPVLSSSRTNLSIEVDSLRHALRRKDEEILNLHSSADLGRQPLGKQNQDDHFNAFGPQDELLGSRSSPRDVAWDEMDMESEWNKKSVNENKTSIKPKIQSRRSIENDAVRKYMRSSKARTK